MPGNAFVPAQSGLSRVFLIEGRARADRVAEFLAPLRMMSLEQGFGDVENIYSPHPRKYDAFEVVGQIRGEEERPTTQLQGRYALDVASRLLELAKIGCAVDVQLHMGQCSDPSEFNEFTKAIILEDALIPNWATDELGALQPDEKSPVNETADISAAEMYEVLEIATSERAGDVVTNEVVDVVFCDAISCGDCEEYSPGCNKIFAVTLAAGGSPGTPADVVFSLDKGATFLAHDIESLAGDPTGIACVSSYVVVTSNDDASIEIALKSEFNATDDPVFTSVLAGIVAGGEPNDISSLGSKAFICGDGGYVYTTIDPTAGVVVVDAGVATTDNLNAINALNEEFAVAVGDSGAVVYTESGNLWQAVALRPVGVGVDLISVLVHSELYWLVGTNDGRMFYTFDKGQTWTEKTFAGSGTGNVFDITRSKDSVLWMSHATTAPAGRIFRSYNGGNSWTQVPEGTGILPANDRINALAACEWDVNLIVGVGLADDAADGFIVLGED